MWQTQGDVAPRCPFEEDLTVPRCGLSSPRTASRCQPLQGRPQLLRHLTPGHAFLGSPYLAGPRPDAGPAALAPGRPLCWTPLPPELCPSG